MHLWTGLGGCLFASVVGVTATLATQVGDSAQVGAACSFFGERNPANVILFESDAGAEGVVRRIVRASGLVQNFTVRAAGVPNAAATIQGSAATGFQRMVLYSQTFMREMRTRTSSEWAAISIMAHEIGHHLNGHTLEAGGSRPKIELEADYYSGFLVQKLGGTPLGAKDTID